MSNRVNNGEIDLNKELTKEAIGLLEKEFNSGWEQYYFRTFDEGESTIVVDDYYDSCFENTVERTINVLKPLGYVLNGYIDYREDGDGKIFVEDNEVSVYDIEDCWIKDAVDDDIIKVLRDRGYTVTKNEPDTNLNNEEMKKYTVTVTKVGSIDLYAETPEKAMNMAEKSNEAKMRWEGVTATDVEECEY